jgi:preprotein translocase subunit SecF
MFGNEEGFFKVVFVLLLIAFFMYAGFQFGMPFYRYTSFKTEAKEIARVSVSGDVERTKAQVFERAQELNIPLKEKDIEVIKTTRGMRVKTAWAEEVDILGIYQKTFDFSIDVEE